jgi:hypothetical protein
MLNGSKAYVQYPYIEPEARPYSTQDIMPQNWMLAMVG